MTRINWDRADRYQPDPGAMRGDPREHRSLDDLIQLAAIYEPQARQVQRKLESGAKVYPFEQRSLDQWHRYIDEIARRRDQ